MDNARTTLHIIAILSLIAGLCFPVLAIVFPRELGNPGVAQVLVIALSGVATWAYLTVISGIAGELEQIRLNTTPQR